MLDVSGVGLLEVPQANFIELNNGVSDVVLVLVIFFHFFLLLK